MVCSEFALVAEAGGHHVALSPSQATDERVGLAADLVRCERMVGAPRALAAP